MTATTIDALMSASAASRDEERDADLLAFTLSMGALAAVVVLMTVIGAILGSTPLLVAAAAVAVVSAIGGTYTIRALRAS